MGTGFRTEAAYGEMVRDPAEVISYEVFELRNTDILDTCFRRYCNAEGLSSEDMAAIRACKGLSDEVAEGTDSLTEEGQMEFARSLVRAVSAAEGEQVRFCLWLASREAVEELYGGTGDDIDEYRLSGIVLADAGYDGKLYGYGAPQRPVRASAFTVDSGRLRGIEEAIAMAR